MRRTRAGLNVMAAMRPTAYLVTTPTKPFPSMSRVSAISASSPETMETAMPSSPAIQALMPTSFSVLPFTVNWSNAKLWASTPGLPALACAPVKISVPTLESIPVIMTRGLGKPRIRIAAVSRSHGSTLANRLPPCPSFTTNEPAPASRAPAITALTSRVSSPRKVCQ